ncbi:MAG: hypothetical protein EXR50_05945 [Dehalococcoidia bacterium]|nr:hypothetical protein [Dehalococcoidia bacterium]
MELDARIVTIRQETPTIKSFLLDLQGDSLPFYPGQYVDLVLEGAWGFETGGFSITSSPLLQGFIQIAVKRIPERMASLVLHDRIQEEDEIFLMGPGGDFYFTEGTASSLVLIAGGIGITPIMSMVRYVDEAGLDIPVTLIYSASSPVEMLFREQLEDIAAKNPRIKCYFTVTHPSDNEPWGGRVGRIDRTMLEERITDRGSEFYVCGPRGMPDTIAGMLRGMGVEATQIQVEEW